MANDNLTGQTIASTYNQLLITADTGGITGSDTNATQIHCGGATAGSGNADTTNLYLSTTRVGIGTSSPGTELHVKGTSPTIRLENSSTADDVVNFTYDNNNSLVKTMATTNAADFGWLDTGGNNIFMIKAGGNVGIGTDSPTNNLDVTGVSATTCRVTSSAIADGTGTGFTVQGLANGEDTEHTTQMGLYVYNSDITDPVSFIRLDSQDSIVHYMWFDDSDALHWSPTVGHIGTTNGTAVFDQTSDERLKDISSDAFPYGLDAVNRITPIQYKFKKDKDKINKLGFGAQTIQDIVPEVVKDTGECLDGYNEIRTEDGQSTFTPKGEIEGNTKLVMEYQQIIPVLVKAIQELSAKVEALENA